MKIPTRIPGHRIFTSQIIAELAESQSLKEFCEDFEVSESVVSGIMHMIALDLEERRKLEDKMEAKAEREWCCIELNEFFLHNCNSNQGETGVFKYSDSEELREFKFCPFCGTRIN